MVLVFRNEAKYSDYKIDCKSNLPKIFQKAESLDFPRFFDRSAWVAGDFRELIQFVAGNNVLISDFLAESAISTELTDTDDRHAENLGCLLAVDER